MCLQLQLARKSNNGSYTIWLARMKNLTEQYTTVKARSRLRSRVHQVNQCLISKYRSHQTVASNSAQRSCYLGSNCGRVCGRSRGRGCSSTIGFHTHEQPSSDLSNSHDQSGDDLLRLSSEARCDTNSCCLEVQHCTIADNISSALNVTTTSRKLFEDDLAR